MIAKKQGLPLPGPWTLIIGMGAGTMSGIVYYLIRFFS